MKIVLSGLWPSHFFEIIIPAMINAKLTIPKIIPHVSTDTNRSPYGSINDINTPHRKLLNVVKKIRANSHGIALMIRRVSFMLIFLFGCFSSECIENIFSSGMRNIKRCPITSSIIIEAPIIAHPIPRNPITNPLATEVNVKPTPLIVQILPFALA
jgi:hypothetical protein